MSEKYSSKQIMVGTIAVAILLMAVVVPLSFRGGAVPVGEDDADQRIQPVARVQMQVVVAGTDSKPKDGPTVYNSVCGACHGSGAAGAPKAGDKGAWVSRIGSGKSALYAAAINGKGGMPAKGGMASLSDEEVKAAVDYLVNQSK